jgi:hypothetical protein
MGGRREAGRRKGREWSQGFRTIRLDILLMQRPTKERVGRMAMRYTTRTISNNPNIPLIRMKFGESSATNNAGTYETIAIILSEIQCGTTFLRRFLVQVYRSSDLSL